MLPVAPVGRPGGRPGDDLLGFFLLPFGGAARRRGAGRRCRSGLPRRTRAALRSALAALFALVGLYQAATHRLLFFAPNVETCQRQRRLLQGDLAVRGTRASTGGTWCSAWAVVLVALALARVAAYGWGVAGGWRCSGPGCCSPTRSRAWSRWSWSRSRSRGHGGAAGLRRATGLAAGRVRWWRGSGCLIVAAVADELRQETSERSDRVSQTSEVVGDHPVAGVGLGGQPHGQPGGCPRASKPTAEFVSHTTPLTVAAELGVGGPAAPTWALLPRRGPRQSPGEGAGTAGLGLALGAALLALFVHSLFYRGFLEDPLAWLVLGLRLRAASPSGRRRGADRAAERERGPRPWPPREPGRSARALPGARSGSSR